MEKIIGVPEYYQMTVIRYRILSFDPEKYGFPAELSVCRPVFWFQIKISFFIV
jgi:hypothetical protein